MEAPGECTSTLKRGRTDFELLVVVLIIMGSDLFDSWVVDESP
jgi:hypothetical protein